MKRKQKKYTALKYHFSWRTFWSENYQPLAEEQDDKKRQKKFIRLAENYDKYRQQHHWKGLTFKHLSLMANQIQYFVQKENSLYIKEFSDQIFMHIYSMIMSNDPRVLTTQPYALASILFHLMLDPIRYDEKLRQCARKILFLFKTQITGTTEEYYDAPASIWKLCLLANLYDHHLDFEDIFRNVDKFLREEAINNSGETTISILQTAVTEKLKRLLNEQAIKDLKTEYSIGPYVVDIAFPASHLIIEIDGIKHHHGNTGQRHRDTLKDLLLTRYGWQVIRIPSYEFTKFNRDRRFNPYIQCKLKDYSHLFKSPLNSDEENFSCSYKPKNNHTFFHQELRKPARLKYEDMKIN